MTAQRVHEGVTYYRFRVTIRYKNPTKPKLRWVRWSPGLPWVAEEVRRELEARGFKPEDVKSATIEELDEDETPSGSHAVFERTTPV